MNGKTILVVEDQPVVRNLLARSLASPGVAVEQAENGPDGLFAARALRPDLIVLDLRLPGLDGHAVCRNLRRDPELSCVPVLMLTGVADIGEAMAALAEGADDYMTKPFNIHEVQARAECLLRRGRKTAEAV